jgi:hypothetical protein
MWYCRSCVGCGSCVASVAVEHAVSEDGGRKRVLTKHWYSTDQLDHNIYS